MQSRCLLMVFFILALFLPLSASADQVLPAVSRVAQSQCTPQNQQICNNQINQCKQTCPVGKSPCSVSCCYKWVSCLANHFCDISAYNCSSF
jgi:hypothetical protein